MSDPIDIRSRIHGHDDVAPDQLLAHPQNFRRHPGEQLDALRGSLRELGWIKTIIVNRNTGHVIDGHARCEEAMRQGFETVPVTYVDLSEEEERLALATLDPITEMAYRDQDALSALLADVQTDDAGLNALLKEMSDGAGQGGGDGQKKDESTKGDEQAILTVECSSIADRDGLADRLWAEGYMCRKGP